ncbi:ribonuclease H-like domain-containing protein [Streptomyces sp. NPDC057854]|uniref:ribonuclease H-like domain-containing protein n=1 Tax=unclassified Streptomyces TaxID=2593676 RepID=UPI003673FC39
MPNNSIAGPRILSIDIETSPVVAHAWGLFKQTVAINQIIEHPRTICFAAKFMGERKVHFYSEFQHGPDVMFHAAHGLLSEADIVMHYNGDGFDLPRLNSEFLLAGLAPPAPYQSIDLLKVMRKNFGFPSNKLAYITGRLGLEGKIKHSGHDLWIRCLAGDPKAWSEMRRYNIRDVKLLEDLHDKVRPWIKNYPHHGLYTGDPDCCPNCGGSDLVRQGYAHTAMGRYQRHQCRGCGTWSRSSRRLDGVGNTQTK